MTYISAKIITLTGNPAIDYVLEVNNLKLGETLLAQSSQQFAAGKGLNVAKALASLNHPVLACGFVGNESAAFFKKLNSDLLKTDFAFVNGENRTHITLIDKEKNQQTHIRSGVFSVTAADCQHLLTKLANLIQQKDLVVLSGSLPQGAPADFYQTIISLCHKRKAIAFLDSSGTALKQGLKAQPYLIKPNREEFEALIKRRLKSEQDLISAAREIITNHGVEWLLISLGEQGAFLVGKNQLFTGSIRLETEDKIISHVGCGDAMLAGFAVAKLQNYPVAKMLELALACGTANLFSAEPGCFSSEKLAQMLKKVQLQKLNY